MKKIVFSNENLAKNIQKYRKAIGYSQSQLAERLFISEQAVSKWECGGATPDVMKLVSISEILGVSVETLLFESNINNTGRMMIGIDGGGTKTEFVLFNENGNIFQRVVLGETNPNICGLEQSFKVLERGLKTLMRTNRKIATVFAGIAGCGDGRYSAKITKFIKKICPTCEQVKCTSDVVNVIYSAVDKRRAIGVICGTGSSVFSCVDDKISKVGGWGYLLGDACSGYAIGRDALRAVLAVENGIGEPTMMTDLIHQILQSTVTEHIGGIYTRPPNYIASFVPVVFQAFQNNDAVAKRILEEETSELALHINHIADKNRYDGDVVMSGSVISRTTIVDEFIRKKLRPNLNIVIPQMPQIYGACKKCILISNAKKAGFEKTFCQEYEAYTTNDIKR